MHPSFEICSRDNPSNVKMMEEIQTFYGGIGSIYHHKSDNTVSFRV